jgi:hypothetical protein
MTNQEDDNYSLMFTEQDPLLSQDAMWMMELVSQTMRDTSKEATVLLYSSGTLSLKIWPEMPFYFNEGPNAAESLLRKLISGAEEAKSGSLF